MYLKRSGGSEPDIHLNDPDQGIIYSIMKHRERLGQLHIFLEHHPLASLNIFDLPAPRLKSFTLVVAICSVNEVNEGPYHSLLSNIGLPNLRKLHLVAEAWKSSNNCQETFQTLSPTLDNLIIEAVGKDFARQRRNIDSRSRISRKASKSE
jgi:hypothetical protein